MKSWAVQFWMSTQGVCDPCLALLDITPALARLHPPASCGVWMCGGFELVDGISGQRGSATVNIRSNKITFLWDLNILDINKGNYQYI